MSENAQKYNIYPKFITYYVSIDKLEEAFRQFISDKMGMEVKIGLDYDGGTYHGQLYFNEDWMENELTDEELEDFHERMLDYLHPDEEYNNFDATIRAFFETHKAICTYSSKRMEFEIHLPYGLKGLL